MRQKTVSCAEASQKVKQLVQGRHWQRGFKGNIPSYVWEDTVLSHLLETTAQYSADNFCKDVYSEPEWERWIACGEADDELLEDKLQVIEERLNGFLSFDTQASKQQAEPGAFHTETDKKTSPKHEQQRLIEDDVTEYCNGRRPGAPPESHRRVEAIRHYVEWKMEGDSLVQEFRKNLALTAYLWENEAIDFLSAPLTRVLSFRDFRDLGLSPTTARGKIISTRKLRDTIDATTYGWYQSLELEFTDGPVYEIVLEIEMPDGTKKRHTVQRSGKPDQIIYKAAGVDPVAERKNWHSYLHVPGYQWYAFMRDQDAPVDEKRYPGFSHIRLTGYYDSVFQETLEVCITLENRELFPDWGSALRYLLTPIRSLRAPFQHRRDFYHFADGYAPLPRSIHLTLEATATPEEVSEYWRKVRSPQARKRGQPSARSLELFRFVLANTPPGTKLGPPNGEVQWERLVADWRRTRKESLRRDTLARTFASVLAALLLEDRVQPKYVIPACFPKDEDAEEA